MELHYILDQIVARDKTRTIVIVVAGMCGEKKLRIYIRRCTYCTVVRTQVDEHVFGVLLHDKVRKGVAGVG